MGRYLDLAKAIKTAELCGKGAFPAQSAALGLKSEEEQVSPLGSTKFDSDRECEISELCEIIPAAGVATCPPGGHAVLLQVPDGVPVDWVQGVADLLAMPPHPDWPEPAWKALQNDALTLLKDWAVQAHRLGWDTMDLFGVDAGAPYARLDGIGLVPLLGGRPIIALTEDAVGIRTATGGALTFHRHKSPPPGRCLIWELEDSP